MLLYLDDDLVSSLDEESENFAAAIIALEYISMAHHEGKHLVTGSRKALQKITNLNQHLSIKNITLYKRLLQEAPQYGAIHHKLSAYARVVGYNGNFARTETDNQTIIELPLCFFNDSSKIQPVNLVTENTADTKLIKHLCRAYSFDNRLNNLKINFQPTMGGGDQTAKEYKDRQDNGVFTICIVDSDKKHPNDSIGETAKKVEIANDENTVFTDYRILDCRELENLISEKQLFAACEQDRTRMKGVNFLQNLEESGNGKKRLYLDFKKGLKALDIFSLQPNSPTRTYWENFNELICEHSDVDTECVTNNACTEKDECLVEGNRVCRSIIMHSLGDKICASTVIALEKLSPFKLFESVCTFTKDLWLNIGGFVFAWSCCGNRLIV